MKRFRLPLLLSVLVASLGGASAQVLIRGDADYRVGSRLRVETDYLVNYESNKTGLLRFRMWATEDYFGHRNGDIHVMGIRIVAPLQAGQRRANVRRTMHLSKPDPGWWFVTLTLEERVIDAGGKRRWEIRDVFQFDEAFFGNPF